MIGDDANTGLRAENEVVAAPGSRPCVRFPAVAAEGEDTMPPGNGIHQGLQVFVRAYVHLGPVVQARTFEVSVVQPKTQGVDQVQDKAGCAAESCDVTGVCRDFRFIEHHVEPGIRNFPASLQRDVRSHD